MESETETASVSEIVSVQEGPASGKPRSKKSKKRRRHRDRDGADQVFDSQYEEYEEDVQETRGAAVAETNLFMVKLQMLRQILLVLKQQNSKKKKMSKDKSGKDSGLPPEMATQLEQDKNRLIKELQDEIEMESHNIELKMQAEAEQMRRRQIQLDKTLRRVGERKKTFVDFAWQCYLEEDWQRYMSCDGLPDPAALPELNTFLYMWSLEDAAASMRTLPRQCEVVIYLVNKLDEIIESSFHNGSAYLADCKQMRQKLRDKLKCWIDMASYALLRQIERDTIRVDLKNSKYIAELAPLVCCFWALLRLPVSIKVIAEKDRKPVEVAFEEVGLTIKMPLDVDCYCTAVRVLWLSYDHYSDLAASFRKPELPTEYRMETDLLSFCRNEYDRLSEIREEQSEGRAERLEEKRQLIKRLLHPPASAPKEKGSKHEKGKGKKKKTVEIEQEPVGSSLPQMESPEEIVLAREEEIRKETRRLLFTRCKKTEINLRKYAMLGGLYQIDLINQPPQPKDMRRDIFLTTLQLPRELEFVKFSRPYKAPPPAPDSERTPEVIEAEMKALEAAMEALVLVTLKLPETAMWFEPPLVAHWLADEQTWSTEDVHDIKYNEEKQTIAFRTGRLGLHGLAGYRFVNLPFQSWELKPEMGKNSCGGVALSITGAIVQLEFLVRENLVCLNSIVGGGSTSIENLLGIFMKLNLLITKLRAAGCDVFPESDAASYLKGLSPKQPVTAAHLKICMGLLSTAYVFSWSRWNATRGPREIVAQIKEVHGCIAKNKPNGLLFVTPSRTWLVDCTEVSPEFTTEAANGNDKFYADAYHYALHNSGIKSRLAMQNVSFKLSTTVTELLEATNIINMSA